jgi:hypothetical protein
MNWIALDLTFLILEKNIVFEGLVHKTAKKPQLNRTEPQKTTLN